MKNEQDGFLQKLSLPLILVCVAVLVMGTDACREDYYLGTQTKDNTPTITITPDDDSDDDEVATPTSTATPTVIGDADEVPVEPTPTVTPTAAENKLGAPTAERDSLLNSLSTLGEAEADAKRSAIAGNSAQKLETSNWLGQAFQKKSEDEQEDNEQLIPPAPLGAVQD